MGKNALFRSINSLFMGLGVFFFKGGKILLNVTVKSILPGLLNCINSCSGIVIFTRFSTIFTHSYQNSRQYVEKPE